MANFNAPHGFRPVRYLNGSPWNEATNLYWIPSTDTNQYFIGDVVKATVGSAQDVVAGRSVTGVPQVVKAAAGETVRGVLVGIVVDGLALNERSIPATKDRGYLVRIVDDPQVVFAVQGDNTTTLANTAVNSWADFAVGTPSNSLGESATQVATATISANIVHGLKIIGLAQGTFEAYSEFLVTFALHDLQDGSTLTTTTATTRAVSLLAGAKTFPVASIVNPKGLRRAAAALARAEYGIARITCIGDSLTLGTYSNDSSIPVDSVADAQGYVGRLRTMLARRYSATAAGFMPANDERNTKVGTGTVSASIGFCVATVRTNNVETLGGALPLPAAATISFPVPACTNIEILYMDSNTSSSAGSVGGNTGTFSYAVDGGGATTTVVDNVNPINYKKITVTGLSNATHTLLLTGVTGTCYIIGVKYYGDTGVVVDRVGTGGATCLDLTVRGLVTHLPAASIQRVRSYFGLSVAPVIKATAVVAGSYTATVADTSNLYVGMPVGSNSSDLTLPCYVVSIESATSFTMSAPALVTNAARNCYYGAGTTNGKSTLTALDGADLYIIPLGHNDWKAQNDPTYATPITTFKLELQVIIDIITAAGACVLFVGEPKSQNTVTQGTETYLINDYWTALEDLALANSHVATIQVNQRWGDFANGMSQGYQSVAGGVHPLKNGCVDMATAILQALVAPVQQTS